MLGMMSMFCRLVEHDLVAILPPRAIDVAPPVSVSDQVPLGLISAPLGRRCGELLAAAAERGPATELAVESAQVASVAPLVLRGAGW